MRFVSSIIVVEDVLRSRRLYEQILQQRVIADFGEYNVGFEGGFALYKKTLFDEVIDGDSKLDKSNNFVLYFEVEYIEEIEQEIRDRGFEFLHAIREQPWGQRVFRFYDYDNHVLEIAEKMEDVFSRLLEAHMSIDDMSRLTGIPVAEIVQKIEHDHTHEPSPTDVDFD